MSTELHLVFGAGPLGLAVVRELQARGKQVRIVNRSGRADVPPNVEVVRGDVTAFAGVREACRGVNVIYNCLNAPYTDWPAKFPAMMRGAIDCAAATGAKLVCADNLYMYGRVAGPITEDLPYAATTRKGRVRAEVATLLMDAHHSGKVRAAIGRASDFYGPGVLSSAAGENIFANALAGRAADVLGNPDLPHTYTYIDDFAKGLVTLGERDEALGRVWHIPSAETLTTRQFVAQVFAAIGAPARLRVAPRWLVAGLSVFMPLMREMKEMLYEFEELFVVDHGRYAKTFGVDVTPHAEAVRRTVEWYRGRLSVRADQLAAART